MKQTNIKIEAIDGEQGLERYAAVIRESFATVAQELELTIENAPTNPAFITAERLAEAAAKGLMMFGLFLDEQPVGFVAVEQANDHLFYLERLAVLPQYRHLGYGKALMDFAFNYVSLKGGKSISIAVVNENRRLKEWYLQYGFVETGLKHFPHLPFTVCFMAKEIPA